MRPYNHTQISISNVFLTQRISFWLFLLFFTSTGNQSFDFCHHKLISPVLDLHVNEIHINGCPYCFWIFFLLNMFLRFIYIVVIVQVGYWWFFALRQWWWRWREGNEFKVLALETFNLRCLWNTEKVYKEDTGILSSVKRSGLEINIWESSPYRW